MRLAELVEVSEQVAATSSRLGKRDLLAGLLARVPVEEVEIATAYLSGRLVQRRTGVGWRSLADPPPPAAESTVSLTEIDATLAELGALAGAGSSAERQRRLTDLFERLTGSEQRHLAALMTGNLRQGAQDALVLEAIAIAADVPLAVVRRAAMFSALTGPVARAALTSGSAGLDAFTLVAGRPVRPMLAASAPDAEAAVARVAGPFAVDTKLDGIRIQVHKVGDEVLVYTRSLDEVADRLPGVVAAARALPARDLVLDGEALLISAEGRPLPFQETASSTSTRDGASEAAPYFFDLLLHDGESLLERPLLDRLARLDEVVPEAHRVRRLVDASPADAQRFFDDAVADGQEGVIVKRLDAPYDAGRRGSAWVKVKPRHTLDLVVIGVEWGSGRRRGWLSNIHLAALDPSAPPDSPGRWVMLGKTFKGMTDEMLAWQTERFLELETGRSGHVVHLRPEQVVEIAFDGLQRSTRYPGGVALRFARVLRYRDDKTADEADTIAAVRSLTR